MATALTKLIRLPRKASAGPPIGDTAIIAACGVGDRAALGELFDRYHLDVYRFAARLTGADDDELDDIVQLTFLEVLRSAKRFRGAAQVRTWLLGITYNVVRRERRTHGRRRANLRAYSDAAQVHAAGPAQPDDVASGRADLRILERAIAALPAHLRAVYVVCEIEQTGGVEAAELLNLRQGTLYRRLHEARKTVRAALREEDV